MSLKPGHKLGSYEIVSQAGAGGMGEVYKAHDPRLERTVAIKVLPEQTAGSADLKERFAREAKAISSLNHANICTLHDIGREDGRDFLVMEFLEGKTLAERLAEGPMATAEMLRIAVQIADALDSAHRQGLVHRDLKPGNVMLTRDGAKLLDFGLAKLVVPEPSADPTSDLTLTAPLTMDGSLVGTMQYMSPEQLEGREADARSDIFAFGALLYEMATGTRPFDGGSQASLIASILKEEPTPVSRLQPMAPPMLDQAISQCLEKDPDNRWQTAGDLKRALLWVAEGGSMAGVPKPVSRRRRTRERVLFGALAVLVLAVGVLGWLTWQSGRREVQVVRSTLPLENATSLASLGGGAVKVSPDGTRLAYVAVDSASGDFGLWVRPLDSLTPILLPGTEDATFPFWSPDSRYLAFFAGNSLKKILAVGGPSLTLCDAPAGRGGSWNEDGDIIFTPHFRGPLHRVAAAGGQSTAISELDSTTADLTHRWAHFLPDGRSYLFFNRTGSDQGSSQDAICLGSLDAPGYRRLFSANSNAVYAEGQLLFVRGGVLMAQPFDPGAGELTGDAFPIAEDVAYVEGWSHGVFSTSRTGHLVYRRGEVNNGSQLTLYDLEGRAQRLIGDPATQFSFTVSHDGNRVATSLIDQNYNDADIWVWDLQRGIRNRLTFDSGGELTPIWSPDDATIAYSLRGAPDYKLMLKPASGAGQEEELWSYPHGFFNSAWSGDGRHIAVSGNDPSNRDIWIVPTDTTIEPFTFMATEFDEWEAVFSPDGRWIAFSSDETGSEEVYVAPFPGPGGKWQVSIHEGDRPSWSADGKRLFYLDNEDHICVAEVDGSGDAFRIGAVEKLFPVSGFRPGSIFRTYDGGRQLLVNERLSNLDASHVVLVQNWSAELEN